MTDTTPDYMELARRWIANDTDPASRAELQRFVDEGNLPELKERMNGSLEFGTAGLRGIVGAGSCYMNRAVIIRTASGLATYLKKTYGTAPIRVVIGGDARLSTDAFMEESARVLTKAGIEVLAFREPVPTPVVAFASKVLGTEAAIVVTASHNPPEYNGYKVYGPDAVQIVEPTDQHISEAIDAVGGACDVPRAEGSTEELTQPVPASVMEAYWREVAESRPNVPGDRGISIVYTPLHGVGLRFVEEALQRGGYGRVHVVAEQAKPDGHFPTVRFPNPEEKGAIDLSVALAKQEKADLILANDPDADRLAVALPLGNGEYRQLSGNQVGVLLGDYLLRHAAPGKRYLVARSIVSTPMLDPLAEAYGAEHDETLTGFKWLGRASLAWKEEKGTHFLFGFEEALGYSVGPVVRDKDGVSGALVFADLVAELKQQGLTVWDRLGELYGKHGLWVSLQKSITRPGSAGIAEIQAAMEKLGATPLTTVAGTSVLRQTDFRVGADQRAAWLGATSMFQLDLEGGTRVLVRPSGTEPKLKIYVDLRETLAPGAQWQAAEAGALAKSQALAEAVAVAIGLG